MRSAMVMALVALGCRGEDSEQSPPDIDSPTAWEFEGEDHSDVVFDEEAVTQVLQEFILQHTTYIAVDVVDEYLSQMEGADETCPTWFEFEGQSYWFADCTADSGTSYSGYAFSYAYEQTDLYGDGNLWDADSIYGFATIIDPDDQWYHLGGAALYGESETDEGVLISNSWLQGGFLMEGEQADPIFEEGISLALQQYAADYTIYSDARYIMFNGQLTGFGLEGEAIDMTGIFAATSMIGNPCEEELVGSVRLRDTSGTWWDVEFDMDPETWEIDDELCDGCGTVTYDGEEVGEVCVDATELLQWETRPW
jgi:hypothetical protein